MDMPVNCLICREPANENCVTLGEKGVASLIQACKSRGEHSLLEDIEEKYTRKKHHRAQELQKEVHRPEKIGP